MAVSKAAMQKRIRAALIASSQEQPLLAFASMDGALEAAANTAGELATRTLATFGCKACKTRFVAENGSTPFCVTCGSDHVTAGAKLGSAQKRFTSSMTDSNLISVQCSNKACGASMILSGAMSTGRAHDHLSCVTCGTSMTEVIDEKSEKDNLGGDTNVGHNGFEAEEEPELSIEAGADEAATKLGVEGKPLKPNGLAAKDEPELSIQASGAGDVFDLPDDEDNVVLGDEDEDDDSDPSLFEEPAQDFTDGDEATAEVDDESDDLGIGDSAFEGDAALDEGDDDLEILSYDDEEGGEGQDSESSVGDDDQDATPDTVDEEGGENALSDEEQDLIDNAFSTASRKNVTVASHTKGNPIADVLGLNDTADNFTLVSMTEGKGKYVAAVKDSVIIARLMPQHATGANRASMHSDGFRAATAHLAKRNGLRATLASLGFRPVKIEVLSAVDVKKQVASVEKKSDQSITAFKKSLGESVALAAVGIDRGQWKGASNPLLSAVTMALAEYGASEADAKRVARRAVTSATQEYVKTLLAQTDKVQSMTAEQRKMLAQTFDVTTAAADDDSDDDFEDDGDDITASFGFPVRASNDSVARILSSVRPNSRITAADAHNAMNVLDSERPLFGG